MRRRLPLVLMGLYLVLLVMGFTVGGPEGDKGEPLFMFAALGFPLSGALIATRRPEHPIGWLLLALALVLGLGLFCDHYVESGATAAAGLAGWYGSLALYLWLPLGVVLLPLIFPDGRLLSPRWRWVVRIGLVACAASLVATGLKPGALDTNQIPDIRNPFGVESLKGFLSALSAIGGVLFAVVIAAAILSVVIRFRRSYGEARLQLKWFAWVGSVMISGFFLAALASLFGDDSPVSIVGDIGWPVGLLSLVVGIPAATGVAVLRYRLYDIDVVIRRTLVYAGLTAILAGAYLGSVLLLQLALDPVTSGSSLAVAVSTLAVAALFRPVRGRVQEIVDRRFYRRKYDAQVTLESFSARLREQVDLEALGAELRSVVADTMQPAHVSLWLKEAGR